MRLCFSCTFLDDVDCPGCASAVHFRTMRVIGARMCLNQNGGGRLEWRDLVSNCAVSPYTAVFRRNVSTEYGTQPYSSRTVRCLARGPMAPALWYASRMYYDRTVTVCTATARSPKPSWVRAPSAYKPSAISVENGRISSCVPLD